MWGRERGIVGEQRSLCSCLARFQPADGLMTELRVEREAAVCLQLGLDPLQQPGHVRLHLPESTELDTVVCTLGVQGQSPNDFAFSVQH